MNIKFQAIVAIQSVEFFNFLSGDGTTNEKPVKAAPWLNIQEKWKLINYGDVTSTSNVKFGDIISFENDHFTGKFLSGYPGYHQLTTMGAMQDFERWKLVNPSNPSSTADITTADVFILQLVNNNGSHEAQINGGGIQSTIPLVTTTGSEFRLIQTSVS